VINLGIDILPSVVEPNARKMENPFLFMTHLEAEE